MKKTINGKLVLKGPLYRGNSRKTIFSRGDNNEVFLPGRIGGQAKAMMSAFTGFWQHPRNPRNNNLGLFENLWSRLFGEKMPDFISHVTCTLDDSVSDKNPHFDLRMGLAIDRDRMAQAEDQNFRLETVYKGTVFDFSLTFDDNKADKFKFATLLQELIQGRFWFGAQKSKGLGKCRLELDEPSRELIEQYKRTDSPKINFNAYSNYIIITLDLIPDSPLLVSWPWGNQDDSENRDSWIDNLTEETRQHQNIMSELNTGKARDLSDIESMPGGKKFKYEHERFPIHQLKKNFPKAIQNDQLLMDFLHSHRNKVHEEIDREANRDLREQSGQVVKGKHYDQIFYRTLTWDGQDSTWEITIPGNTMKGAFRTKAQQILRTIKAGKGCKESTPTHQDRFCDDRHCPVCLLFGRQGSIARVFFSDACPVSEDKLLDEKHRSMDQISVDPKTGTSQDNTKQNALFAYGPEFTFRCELVLTDADFKSLAFIMYLLRELNLGAIPLGGKKSLGFGHVQGRITQMDFLCMPESTLDKNLKRWKVKKNGTENVWQHYQVDGDKIWKNNKFIENMDKSFSDLMGEMKIPEKPFITPKKFVSHRQYSKLCGMLTCELEALTPTHVRESGEPSFQSSEALGYDFCSMSPPGNQQKPPVGQREYVIPPSTLKGTLRMIFNLLSQKPCSKCSQIDKLCDTCKLFGWVGDSALMGRLTFSPAGSDEKNQFEWHGISFGYKGAQSMQVNDVRMFPHTNIINEAVSRHGQGVEPSDVQKNISLNRYAKTGSVFSFKVHFTNLQREELQKLIWAIELEKGLGHKIGKGKALHFGSCRINIREAHLIDWKKRFSSLNKLGLADLDIAEFRIEVENNELKKALTLPQ